ncbi:hypothetical protein L1049_023134 [Liquidambar formosana]|uniref:Uncharacterized protein n=1 Tax=Liquidambar formosana TaxID=63359 RepID=A0AAP0WRB9_LIQFO
MANSTTTTNYTSVFNTTHSYSRLPSSRPPLPMLLYVPPMQLSHTGLTLLPLSPFLPPLTPCSHKLSHVLPEGICWVESSDLDIQAQAWSKRTVAAELSSS